MSSPLTATATSNGDDSSDDAPEEFTSLQGLLHSQEMEIAKAQQHSLSRARRDRKKRAQRLTPKSKSKPPPAPADDENEMVDDDDDPVDSTHQSHLNSGMLSNHIISLLAARQKQVFLSDSDEERTDIKPKRKKKKANLSGIETVILKDLPPSHCVQSSLEFLNKRKMQAPRSSAILNNSNQALRLLSSSGLLK